MSQTMGVGANSAVATTTVTVITNDGNGYTLAVAATSTPAMQNQSSTTLAILDYPSTTPQTWSIPSGTAAFGYSAYGNDIATATWGTTGGTGCNGTSGANATSTTLKYRGFTTSNVTVSSTGTTTAFTGNTSNICYAAEQKNYFIPVTGGGTNIYQATVIVTATTN